MVVVTAAYAESTTHSSGPDRPTRANGPRRRFADPVQLPSWILLFLAHLGPGTAAGVLVSLVFEAAEALGSTSACCPDLEVAPQGPDLMTALRRPGFYVQLSKSTMFGQLRSSPRLSMPRAA